MSHDIKSLVIFFIVPKVGSGLRALATPTTRISMRIVIFSFLNKILYVKILFYKFTTHSVLLLL